MNESQLLARALVVTRRAEAWWVVGGDIEMGPYRTRADAQDDRRGVQRFLRNANRRGYVTSQPVPSRAAARARFEKRRVQR